MGISALCALTGRKPIKIVCRTLLLAEATEGESAAAIRRLIDTELKKLDGVPFDELTKNFTFVTDYCATIPPVVGASVSQIVTTLDEK